MKINLTQITRLLVISIVFFQAAQFDISRLYSLSGQARALRENCAALKLNWRLRLFSGAARQDYVAR